MGGVGKAGIFPLFKMANVADYVEQTVTKSEENTLMILQRIGEEFVNKARVLVTYTDRTGNLRSSIGYSIYKDGELIDSNYKIAKGGVKGEIQGESYANEINSQENFPKGYVLIGVAGMKYAKYVEAKHYDVITGSAPTTQDVKEFMDEIFK